MIAEALPYLITAPLVGFATTWIIISIYRNRGTK